MCVLACPFAFAQGLPRLITNPSGTISGSLPAVEHLADVDGVLFFAGRDSEHGQELWRSDGTVAGTYLVKDINPGAGSSFPRRLNAAGDKLFFFASDLEGGFRLWTSDGTAGGTRPVATIEDGREESLTREPVAAGGKLFIQATKGQPETSRLWCSDGTAEGTRILPFPEDTAEGLYYSTPMVVGDDYFLLLGAELWCSDGTPDGTKPVVPYGENGFYAWNAVQAGDRIYLQGDSLRVFDPKSGKAVSPEFWDARMEGFVTYSARASGDLLLFDGARDDESWETWVTDGTAKGTSLLYQSGMRGEFPWWGEGIEVRGRHLMQAETYKTGAELWISNGTRKGTKLLCNLAPGQNSSRPSKFTKVGNRAFFEAWTPHNGTELWMSSGTAMSTDLLADLHRGEESSEPDELTASGDLLFWTADDGNSGRQLWRSKGTRKSTRRLTSLESGVISTISYDGRLDGFTEVLGDRYFFPKADEEGYSRLWSTDGSAAGTRPLAPSLSGRRGSYPQDLMAAGGRIYYQTSEDTTSGTLLWATGGDSSNTSVVLDLSAEDDTDNWHGGVMAAFGQTALLTKWKGLQRDGLWLHRQSEPLTAPVAPGDASPFHPGELAYFTGYDAATGYEPWTTDGTLEGTRLLRDLRSWTPYDPTPLPPDPFSSRPEWLAQAGGKTYFSAESVFVRRGLWVTDGTSQGTGQVFAVDNSHEYTFFSKVHAWGERLIFFAGYSTGYYSQASLWITDGTWQGTTRLLSVSPDFWYLAEKNNGPMFAELNGRIYFSAKTEENGQELWSTDGTVGGTQRIKDIFAGEAGSKPGWLTHAGNAIYFTANDGRHGWELWRTDGTETGTVLVTDPTADAGSSGPWGLGYTGGKLFYMATTEDAGAATWVIDHP